MADELELQLVSTAGLLLSEPVKRVIVPGFEGEFTVLPRHSPFFTSLRAGILRISMPGNNERRYFVRGGFAEVGPSAMIVLAQLAINLEKISRAWLSNAISEAEQEVANLNEDDALHHAEHTLAQLKDLQQFI
jgi:F-type H+-transporting ATPase subunit epsilon